MNLNHELPHVPPLGASVTATAVEMQRCGGSFVRSLGDALLHADAYNQQRLLAAFPDYFGRYAQHAANRAEHQRTLVAKVAT